MNKIIFLDIDGPVIPTTVSIYNSMFRLKHNSNAIIYLNKLCKKTGAKIVTNTMHNINDYVDGNIKDDLIKWGIKEEYFHESWKTIFPLINYKEINSKIRGIGRLHAIDLWLVEQKDIDNWVCFDDRYFTTLPNLIHIEDGLGIKKEHYDYALKFLGKKYEYTE
jgi:hypothetical protein